MIGQIAFAVVSLGALGWFTQQALRIRRNILLGKPEKISGDVALRLKNTALIAFGQQKMFKRWIPALLHLFIYVAFITTQIELIEIFIDGFTGQHRVIWHSIEETALASLYTFIISFIEILSVLAFVATFIFLARRNLLKVPRFHKPEMKGWPTLDGNIILYLEICLIIFIFMMNGGDKALQLHNHADYHHTGDFAISSLIAPALAGLSDGTLILIERIGWWGHILTVFVFLNYLPRSKHLHIMLAFPNTYFARITPKGQLQHMPSVTEQVKPMFEDDEADDPFQTPAETAAPKTKNAPSETIDDIFGDSGSDENSKEESLDDIFGDTGNSNKKEESLDDIFGDTGNSNKKEESLDDIFGDTGNSNKKEESLDDIFGDTGNSNKKEESLDDIFGDTDNSNKKEESLDDIFGDTGNSNKKEESLDDIFGDAGKQQNQQENVDDIFGKPDDLDAIFKDDKTTNDVLESSKNVTQQQVEVPPVEEIAKFGANDIFDLSWKNILDAYTCTECGRCTSMCPANITGKKLSPRKIMMDVRDRTEEIGNNLDKGTHTKANYDDGKTLFDYISTEELRACTTCNACVEACPVMINPLDIIMQLRRYQILDQADAPEEWNGMFTNIENNGAPWQFAQEDRAKWVEEVLD